MWEYEIYLFPKAQTLDVKRKIKRAVGNRALWVIPTCTIGSIEKFRSKLSRQRF
jgi:hypothetical protein